jgi:D-3-phosphoglycerate dehydrogenase
MKVVFFNVLANINKVFSDNQINVAAQYLQTRDSIGYVVIDIDAAHSDIALAKLARVPGTLRCRGLF